MPTRAWFQPALITILSVLLTTVTLLALAIREHDVRKIDSLLDDNARQQNQIEQISARQQVVLHELDRLRDRMERLEGRR